MSLARSDPVGAVLPASDLIVVSRNIVTWSSASGASAAMLLGREFAVTGFCVCVELSWVGGDGGAPWTKKKWGPEGWGPKLGAERVLGRRVGSPKFHAFFSLCHRKIRSFLPSLGVFSWNFGGV